MRLCFAIGAAIRRAMVEKAMQLSIQVSGDIDKLLRLDRMIEFATFSTLTKAAKEGQAQVQIALRAEFIIRGTWSAQSSAHGIKVKPAKRGDLESAVYTGADWLLESEGYAGGVKRPESGTHLTVPVEDDRGKVIARGGRKTGKIKATEKARYLLDHADTTRAFKIKTASGYTLIVRRTGGKGTGKKTETHTEYIFRTSVKVPHQSAVIEPVIRTVKEVVPSIFNTQLAQAYRTQK